MSSQKSVFNGRSGCPVSVRCIDSNASVSAVDIALAFKNKKFNKYDLQIIKTAYSKFMKSRVWKRMVKRRNLKLFQTRTRKDTGYDSGEQSSDSSISSDDGRSTRTAVYKEILPISRPRPRPRSRFSRTDMTQLRNTIQESDMYQNYTENFKQNSLRNMLVDKNTQVNVSAVTNTNINDEISRSQSNGMQTKQAVHNFKETAWNTSVEGNSGNEETFSEVTVRENVQVPTLLRRKRNFDFEEANYSDIRQKLTSPIKHTDESLISSTLINKQNKNFTFKMSQMPVRKSTEGKNTIFNNKLIAPSAPPIVDDFDTDFSLHSNKQAGNRDTTLQHNSIQRLPPNKETGGINNETEISQNITDVSMKSSFIKRKRFSQKLDLIDKKNQSIENVVLNSPQTKLYAGEKHKVKKLASSQSCLNLEVFENNNVLDLINKIVPSNKINIINVQNKKETRKSQDEDKWDVTSVISMCNNDDVSDTYTGEEIFKTSQSTNNKVNNKTNKVNNKTNKVINITSETNKPKKVTKQKIKEIPKTKNTTKKIKLTQCKGMVNKLSPKKCNNYVQDKPIPSQIKRTVSSYVKSFWDTDSENDMEESNLNTSVTEGKNKRGTPKSNIKKSSAQEFTSKSKETCNKQKKCDAIKNIETNIIRIQPSRKVNESKRQSSPKSNQSSFNCSNISSRSLRVRKKTECRCCI